MKSFFRPAIVFAAAYMISGVLHESAHALTAYAFDVPFTFFHFAVDLARDRGTLIERAIIAAAGPLCSLIIGLICWFAYRRATGSRSELMLLYLATFGAGTFFGNLMSASFIGDFSRAADIVQTPLPARYAVSFVGLVAICAVHFFAGSELRRLSSADSSKSRAILAMVVFPVVAGTFIVALSFVPMPSALAFARLTETTFWVFAAAGIFLSWNAPSGDSRTLDLNWADIAVLAAVILVVRFVAGGIVFRG